MLYVYTGDGKGKTTAAIGQIIRSLGHGWRVCLIQLFKGKEFYGEQKALKKFKNLAFCSFAPKHPFCLKKPGRETVAGQCGCALKRLKESIKSGKYDLIVLEEFNIALRDGFIGARELLPVIKRASKSMDVVITGRGAPKALIRLADLVTEMKEIKHPFKKGIKARKGIEF